MTYSPKILAFAGSTRDGSFNKKLVAIAAQAATKAGAEVTLLDLKEYPMPLFDQDYEAQKGMPKSAKDLKALMVASDGFLIASPEYNSSITGVLKNTLDWVSRDPKEDDNEPLIAFKGKVASIMSASPSGLGGLRGLVHLRAILGNIGVLVLPTQKSIPHSHKAFNDDNSLKDKKQQAAIETQGAELVSLIRKLKA